MNDDDLAQKLQAAQDEIVGHLATIRRQSAKIGQLTRERDPLKRARAHEHWEAAERLFGYWKQKTGRAKSKTKLDATRFDMVRPFIEADGEELCMRAIEGIAFDPFSPANRKNGTPFKLNRFKDAFGDREKFEEACNRAPIRATNLEDDAAEVEARR